MIHYEVTLECSESTAPALEQWMRNSHVPEMLATGCFVGIHFDRSDQRFRTVYQAAGTPELDRYLRDHAAEMRERFRRRFPDGVAVSRESWQQLQSWVAM